jgi:hypothetical protein
LPATFTPRRFDATAAPRRPTIHSPAVHDCWPDTLAMADPTMKASAAMTSTMVVMYVKVMERAMRSSMARFM